MKNNSAIAILKVAAIALCALSLLVACNPDQATISFSITDAPIDPSTVKAVNLTVSSVGVNENGTANPSESSWNETVFNPPIAVNLLDLQNGITAALGDLQIKGGTQVNQIRLGVDSVSVVETDDSVHEATIPSATGFKIVNAFQVPLSGAVSISIDFDVRKAIVLNAGGYFVKPAVRAVVDNEAGRINGSVGATGAVAVYAYADDAFVAEEAVPAADGSTFQASYSATLAKSDGTYVLAFMDVGTYDLYAVDASGAVVGTLADVVVEADRVTANQNF